MEPTNNNQEASGGDVLHQNTEPVHHTISGGPETLHEIQQCNAGVEQIITPTMNATFNNVVEVSQSPVIENVIQPTLIQESFFDRHITAIVFWVNLLVAPIVNYLIMVLISLLKLPSLAYIFLQYSGLVVFIITIILGIVNFHGKGKEIFKGIGYVFLLIAVILLVGLGFCLLVIGGSSIFR